MKIDPLSIVIFFWSYRKYKVDINQFKQLTQEDNNQLRINNNHEIAGFHHPENTESYLKKYISNEVSTSYIFGWHPLFRRIPKCKICNHMFSSQIQLLR
ncbi:hypothetical protein WA026_002125 [Henosepilachna vigintioctopunctata]|uniref:Uncharacterized protein n=1 Tax=Henosepilachna vigintioctopunctata TaxID=420089 RepID=A0AAW1U099_9CUCU